MELTNDTEKGSELMQRIQKMRTYQFSWVILLAVLAVVSVLFAFGMTRNGQELQERVAKENTLQIVLSEKEQQNSELSKKIDAVGSMGQIESAARSELMYRKPEEVSFEVENPELLDSYTEEEWKLLMAEMDNQ